MKPPRGLLKSPKISRSHTTLIPEACGIVETLKAQPRVTKIVLGIIDPGPRRRRGLTLRDVPAGLKITVRGHDAVQTLYALTTDRVAVRRALEGQS